MRDSAILRSCHRKFSRDDRDTYLSSAARSFIALHIPYTSGVDMLGRSEDGELSICSKLHQLHTLHMKAAYVSGVRE